MWGFRVFRRFEGLGWFHGVGRSVQTPAERAARWLRERLEAETRARYGWLDAGVWADVMHGGPGDTKQAAKRLVDASLVGDEVG